ncbi:hypothetical protein EJ08DRAFT_733326 [Tothia fuscella]|uniref:Uncharacterized protein n=1 Tax=Tothia fuscella TaxID=1048955 RepID=A0A9P4NU77_9PEZI|nr:hypothetical protein EJ08DRAFT_733326 [Tothia fuscella]
MTDSLRKMQRHESTEEEEAGLEGSTSQSSQRSNAKARKDRLARSIAEIAEAVRNGDGGLHERDNLIMKEFIASRKAIREYYFIPDMGNTAHFIPSMGNTAHVRERRRVGEASRAIHRQGKFRQLNQPNFPFVDEPVIHDLAMEKAKMARWHPDRADPIQAGVKRKWEEDNGAIRRHGMFGETKNRNSVFQEDRVTRNSAAGQTRQSQWLQVENQRKRKQIELDRQLAEQFEAEEQAQQSQRLQTESQRRYHDHHRRIAERIRAAGFEDALGEECEMEDFRMQEETLTEAELKNKEKALMRTLNDTQDMTQLTTLEALQHQVRAFFSEGAACASMAYVHLHTKLLESGDSRPMIGLSGVLGKARNEAKKREYCFDDLFTAGRLVTQLAAPQSRMKDINDSFAKGIPTFEEMYKTPSGSLWEACTKAYKDAQVPNQATTILNVLLVDLHSIQDCRPKASLTVHFTLGIGPGGWCRWQGVKGVPLGKYIAAGNTEMRELKKLPKFVNDFEMFIRKKGAWDEAASEVYGDLFGVHFDSTDDSIHPVLGGGWVRVNTVENVQFEDVVKVKWV